MRLQIKNFAKGLSFRLSLEEKIRLWICLGPISLLTASLIGIYRLSSQDWPLLLMAELGLLLSLKWKFRGTAAALAAILILAVIQYMQRSAEEHFWIFSLAAALESGLILVALSLQKASSFFQDHVQQLQQSKEHTQHLQNLVKESQLYAIQDKKDFDANIGNLQKELHDTALELESVNRLMSAQKSSFENTQKENEKYTQEILAQIKKIELLEFSLAESNFEIKKLQEEKENQDRERQLIQLLNETRVEKYQLSILNEASNQHNQNLKVQRDALREELGKISAELKIATSQEFWKEDPDLAKELEKNSQIEKMYIQLRQQFEDKSGVLNQTRKELFQLETKIFSLQKECEHSKTDLNPEEMILIRNLREVEDDCKNLELQIECLQELVTELIGKRKTRKPRKTKVLEKDHLELSFD